jgi:hypothetical protein
VKTGAAGNTAAAATSTATTKPGSTKLEFSGSVRFADASMFGVAVALLGALMV